SHWRFPFARSHRGESHFPPLPRLTRTSRPRRLSHTHPRAAAWPPPLSARTAMSTCAICERAASVPPAPPDAVPAARRAFTRIPAALGTVVTSSVDALLASAGRPVAVTAAVLDWRPSAFARPGRETVIESPAGRIAAPTSARVELDDSISDCGEAPVGEANT